MPSSPTLPESSAISNSTATNMPMDRATRQSRYTHDEDCVREVCSARYIFEASSTDSGKVSRTSSPEPSESNASADSEALDETQQCPLYPQGYDMQVGMGVRYVFSM